MSAPILNAPLQKEMTITVDSLIKTGKSLADLLAEETRLIEAMQISAIGELQERKLKLTSLLERYKKYFAAHPDQLKSVTPAEIAELKALDERFQKTSRVNYEKLLVARAVNKAIVTCVTKSFVKKQSNNIYNASGAMYNTYKAPVSMTLNKMM